MRDNSIQDQIKLLKDYFLKSPDVSMAFLFGSYSMGRETYESDFDVAVYFRLWEDANYKIEDNLWSDITEIVNKEVDLVCLNNAPASLVSNIIKTGIPLIIKDKKLYWNIYLRSSLEAEDFSSFAEDYFEIYKKAKSLIPEQKVRLIERLQFLDGELKEIDIFKKLDSKEYHDNKFQRRNVERWTENIINASIDIAKIVLASEKRMMPKTYEEALRNFGILAGLTEEESKNLSRFANLRNILAHEYLDVLYGRIQIFIKESPSLYHKVLDFLETYLNRK